LPEAELNTARQVLVFQSSEKAANVTLDRIPQRDDRFNGRVVGRVETLTARGPAAAIGPAPFRTEDVNHGVSDRTVGPRHGLRELLRTQLGDHAHDLAVGPSVVFVERVEVLDGHRSFSPSLLCVAPLLAVRESIL
jgi:hypothetical protein